MRFSIILLLLALSLVTLSSLPKTTSSEPNSTTTAWNDIVQAFAAIRSAESDGASHESIVRLSSEMNTALAYYENATILTAQNNTASAANYSTLSISLPQNITSEATGLDETARNQQSLRLELVYGTAFVFAVVSAATIVEADRIRRVFRKRRTLTMESESN